MSFILKEHTADIAVEASGDSLDAVFADVAAGLTAAHCESVPDPEAVDAERFSIGLRAESKEALLFDYLDELIYERDVRGVLPAHHEATVDGNGDWVLEAHAYGIPLDAVSAREIKAVTYSEMELEETPTGWRAYVVFDV
ncbi:archease [Natronomonas amylolytica]|uniref:archease n=1 Tax=Natronomonas amylolytica TaxID=3108498 RepID=UPI00300A5F3B